MNEPPDPLEGQAPLEVACNIVVGGGNDSSMDTDCSFTKVESRKRRVARTTLCKHCIKKRRKKYNGTDKDINKDTDCLCENTNNPIEKIQAVTNEPLPNILRNSTEMDTNPPRPQISRTAYDQSDLSPYIVHVQKIITSPNDGAILHPIAFGNFLKRNKFYNIINGSVKKIGRNRISLAFSNYIDANTFINSDKLSQNQYKAFVPSTNVTRMGIIRGVPADWTPEEVKDTISVPLGCGEILKVRRLNYKTMLEGKPVWKPSQTIVLTFDGQVLPKRIFICYNALAVELYTYPTIQCYNCCRFGHTKTQCRSKPRCYKCGQEHSAETCRTEEEHNSCCLCSGSHFATSKSCPEFERQKSIKLSMAQNCISYAEASKMHPPISKSYAQVLNSAPS